MKLHLPLSLLAALLACYPLAHADYQWNVTSDSDSVAYSADDWKQTANWTVTGESSALTTGPGISQYDPISFVDKGTLSFSGLALEGWAVSISVSENTHLTVSAETGKYQSNANSPGKICVDSTSSLVWDFNNKGRLEGPNTFDIQSYRGLTFKSAFSGASNYASNSAVTVKLGTLGSILFETSASSGATFTFTNTSLLQYGESGFNTNAGQYTLKNVQTGDTTYVLYSRKLLEYGGDATSVGGTLASSGHAFSLADGGTSLTLSDTALTAGADSVGKYYVYVGTDGAYYVDYVGSTSSLDISILTWNGTSGDSWNTSDIKWLDSSSATTTYTNNIATVFTADHAGTVTIAEDVAPYMITIQGGDYTFEGTGSIIGNGSLTMASTGTVTINTNNSSYTGSIALNSGTLVMGNDQALGTGTLAFNGGTLQYADGVTTDIGSRISSASTSSVKVNVGSNDVAWNWAASGVTANSLQALGIEKSGSGTLTISINSPSGTTGYAGNISVKEGTLLYKAPTSNKRKWTGTISVDSGATLRFAELRALSDAWVACFSNTISGAGTIVFGENIGGSCPGGGRFRIEADNSGFTGTMILRGQQSTALWNLAVLVDANSMGTGTLQLDGRGILISAAGSVSSCNLDLTDKGGWLHGDDGTKHTISGALTSTTSSDLAIHTSSNNITYIFSGDATGFLGTLTTVSGSSFQFGTGSAATLSDGEFLNASQLKGNGSFIVNYSGSEDSRVIYSGVVAETASVTVAGSDTLVLTGNNTTTGTLNINSGTSAQLGNGGSDDAHWLGSISGAGDLAINTAGTFTVQSDDQLALTGNVILEAGTLDLADVAVSNTIVVKDGTLSNASSYATAKGVSIDSIENASISLDGLSSASISSVSLASGSTLAYTGSDSDLDLSNAKVSIVVGKDQVTEVTESGTSNTTPIVTANTLVLSSSKTTLSLSNSAVVDTLKTVKLNDTEAKLTLVSGTLEFKDDSVKGLGLLLENTDVLTNLGLVITDVDGGSLIIGGHCDEVYLVTSDATKSDPDGISEYATLDPYKAVVLDEGQTLTADLAGERTDGNADGLVVKNLLGVTGSSLVVNNTGDTTAVVVFDNSSVDSSSVDTDATLDNGTAVRVATDSEMEGKIVGGDNVSFLKEGEGSLTVSGSMDVDSLTIKEGTLTATKELQANTVTVQKGSLDLGKDSKSEIDSLVLDGSSVSDAQVSVAGQLQTSLSEGSNAGSSVTIANTGKLTLTGVKNSITKSSISGHGTLVIDNASLAISESGSLSGTNLVLKTGKLSLGEASATTSSSDAGTTALLAAQASKSYSVKTLNGDESSSIQLTDSTLVINGTGSSSYSGELAGSGTLDVKNGTLNLNNSGNKDISLAVTNAQVILNAASATTKNSRAASSNEISSQGITLNSGAELTIGSTGATDQTLSIGSGGLTLNSGSTLSFNLATEDEGALDKLTLVSTTGTIKLNDGSTVKLINDNTLVSADVENLKVTLMEGGSAATVGNVAFQAAFLSTVYGDLKLQAEGNNVVLTGVAREDNVFSPGALSANSTAGSELLWKARFSIKNGDSILKTAYLGVNEMLNSGDNAGAKNAMAAIAGSTVNALGTAQRDALQSQMGWIRNRTVTMGVAPDFVYDDMPYYHMWVEGTGASAKLNTDGDEGGYKLNSWGGTVGFDVDLTEHFTLGAALSAQYGSLSSSAAEYASGDLDSYYVSVFCRYQKSAWAHTVILTGSFTDATLDRTVNYGTGTYKTLGDTDGTGFGAMYELTYDMPMNEDKTSLFQPLFNASIVNTTMKAYDETGAGNAGLNVGKQDWTTATLALGARWMGLVGTNVFGREALLEVRANIAQDFGDDQGETRVALQGRPDFTQTVYGAKVGKIAGQFGVGLNLPVGQNGTVFVNGNADVRSGAHSFNGSLGYRYSF